MDKNQVQDESMPAIPTEGEWVYPRVAEFYRGKTVAITGGTGSLGQAIIEKLLRCAPEVKKIILLIRKKKEVEPSERLATYIENEAFDNIRETNPKFADKLVCVSCDLEAEDLGLNSNSKFLIQSEVDIFIHSAANLKFNEKLRVSYTVNALCVRRLLKLCKGISKLKALVHVSTAYSHCDRPKIEEKFYDCGVDYLEIESSLKCLSDEALAKITPELLGDRPNIYTLTKALGEDVIARESGDLPVCIARPSMIIPAWQEPMPGWCTTLYGPTAFFVAYAKGVLKSVILEQDIVGDIIPIDLVVNGVIVAGMKTACDFTDNPRDAREDLQRGPEVSFTEEGLSDGEEAAGTLVNIRRNIPIYHFTTGATNPVLIRDLVKIGRDWYREYPLDPHRLPSVTITRNRFIHKATTFFHQTIPAYIDDAKLTICNKERKMQNINQKIISGLEVMEFFFTNQWQWDIKNADALQTVLCPKDKEVFGFDARCFTWKEHLRRYIIGTRKYLVKQNMDAYPAARKTLERLRLQNLVVNSIGAIGLFVFAVSNGAFEAASDIFAVTYNFTSAYM